jgi:LL-diaminopimelate aminotransferase
VKPSKRLETLPANLFAELEWKAVEMRTAGVDVISLGVGDPDVPTFAPIVHAGQLALADAGTHCYPTNRGRREFREAVAAFYDRRFGVRLDPEREVIPAVGGKECIFNLNLAFLDPGHVALVPDPGYSIYTAGPLLVGAEPELLPLLADNGFVPDLQAIAPEIRSRHGVGECGRRGERRLVSGSNIPVPARTMTASEDRAFREAAARGGGRECGSPPISNRGASRL